MFRSFFLFAAIAFVTGSAYIWTEMPQLACQLRTYLPSSLPQVIPSKELTCFEQRYSIEQLVQKHQKNVKEKGGEYEAPRLELYPYLLMEVKYVKHGQTYESYLLWSLTQGEMVLNTQNWSMTHGYDDCLAAKASRDEMRVVNALALAGGQLDRGAVIEKVKLDPTHIDEWLEKCRRKHLVVQTGSQWRLHMQKPVISQDPVTQWRDDLVERSGDGAQIISARFREGQIMELAQAAFGTDFAIKRSQLIYLPVYNITFKAADGSKKTLKLNAYTNTPFSS
jgi:hypothetical protein